MRLGRVEIRSYYIVDLDNKNQVSAAKEMVMEDVYSMYRFDEIYDSIQEIEDPSLIESDITDIILELTSEDSEFMIEKEED